MSGVDPFHTPRSEKPAITARARQPHQAGHRPAEHAPPAPLPRRGTGPGPVPAEGPDPGPAPRQVGRELAPEHEHGAQVLERDREAELADEGGAPLGLLERHVGDAGQPDGDERRRDHDRDRARAGGTRSATRRSSRRRNAGAVGTDARRDVGHRPHDEAAADEGRHPGGQPPARRHAARPRSRGPRPSSANAASESTHSSPFSGNRRPANCPAAAPAPAAANAAKRSWRQAGPRRAAPRSIGAMSTWRTSGASTASGPPRLPERSPTKQARAAATPSQAGPSIRTVSMPAGRQLLVADDGRQDGHAPRRPTIATRYTWYSASIQWISAIRCRRRARRRSPMTETGTGIASGTTPRRAR